eukprot:11572207-Heterocapsa_arctica.AAC.1
MATREARRALEAAEKLSQDSQQELVSVGELLQYVEAEVMGALRTKQDRKTSTARAKDELEAGLARA